MTQADVEPAAKPGRLASIDAYRGLVMLLIMAEALEFRAVAQAVPTSRFWAALAAGQTHVEWLGCSLHDLIQPSFSFLVGVALPFSLAGRQARAQPRSRITAHAFLRALILVALGILLRSVRQPQINFTFQDTLSQIGLGYGFLFLLGFCRPRRQWIALGLILAGYWAAFALYPPPPAGFDYAKVGVSSAWLSEHGLAGFAAHWNKNSNLAWAFDTWFLNLFPRPAPFRFEPGGYATLSFIPTLGTMILGLLAGGVLRGPRRPWSKVRYFVPAGLLLLAGGLLLDWLGVCPVVKRIWTPGWTLWSGGWCFLFLAAFYTTIEIRGWRRWAFPLVVVGMNSIAAYCMESLFSRPIRRLLESCFGNGVFRLFGAAYEPVVLGACVVAVLWLVLFVMYRRKLLVRI